MKAEYLCGKKSKHCFFSFVHVFPPERRAEILEMKKDGCWFPAGESWSLPHRENSAKAIYRWVKKQNFKPGTTVVAYNWYIGANILFISV